MSNSEAILYLNEELTSNTTLTTTQKAELSSAISDLESTTITDKTSALEILNDLYFDATLTNRETFGEAVFVVSYTVNPDAPYPKIRA